MAHPRTTSTAAHPIQYAPTNRRPPTSSVPRRIGSSTNLKSNAASTMAMMKEAQRSDRGKSTKKIGASTLSGQ